MHNCVCNVIVTLLKWCLHKEPDNIYIFCGKTIVSKNKYVNANEFMGLLWMRSQEIQLWSELHQK